MRFLFEPRVRDNSESITATNSSLNYSPANIAHPFIEKRFQSISTSSVITITLDDSYSLDCFFYALHNLTALTVVFKNAGGSTLDTIVVSTINDIGVEYFTQVDSVKTIEVTVTSTSNPYLGLFDTGLKFQGEDFLNAYPLNLKNNSLSKKSTGGQSTNEHITPLRAYDFSFAELLKDYVEELLDKYKLNGSRPIFIDITEGSRTAFEPIYANITKPPNSRKIERRYRNKITLEEAR